MASIEIAKIQLRRGPESDLPGAPTSLSPLLFAPGLDQGELGFTTDTGRLFVGQSFPTQGSPSYNRSSFPYQNIEVLTENSPLGDVMGPFLADDRNGYIASAPLIISTNFLNLQTVGLDNQGHDFYLDLPVSGVNAVIRYFVFDSSHLAMRHGQFDVIWNSEMVGQPVFHETSYTGVGNLTDLQWQVAVVGTLADQHVVLQYRNQTGDTPTVYFKIERPLG